ncbi:glycoside hydrolase family 27 protein [Apiospora sp. TS-2023a]
MYSSILLALPALALAPPVVEKRLDNGLGRAPALGWSSWNLGRNLKKHDINISSSICYIKPCRRSRLGLKSEEALKRYLKDCLKDTTLADNEQAAADSNIALVDESSSDPWYRALIEGLDEDDDE